MSRQTRDRNIDFMQKQGTRISRNQVIIFDKAYNLYNELDFL